ncbi:hypothetical protein CBR_g25941 [Chara braunii]|uniref:Retrotransposon gag domain-containing protein n=1 Tax=Chara braunii TaxID=69332 RepID=A0A388L6T2_CHABU|nr:hypothetical protein CBR_g25941 [Chara braunii]|eukprot:GBG78007.1 hypothetical protein CBR_g25941 [Chara braunii]
MADQEAQQQPQAEVEVKTEVQRASASHSTTPLTATLRKELQDRLQQKQALLAELERQEAAEMEAATDASRSEYLLEQLTKAMSDERCTQVTRNLAEWAVLGHKATSSYFTNWDDRMGRLERRVEDLAAQQSKLLDTIQALTAQLTTAKLITPQPPVPKVKPSPSLSDQRGPKIPAPNKFKGDDPKVDVGDWTASTKAYLRGFTYAEQTKVATVLGLLEGPALKWATSTSSRQDQRLEDWAFGLGVERLLQALKDRFADTERACKAADKIARLGQQRYSGSLQSLFTEFEQLTSTPELVVSADDLLTNFCRAAPEKFVVALYNVGNKDWRSFGRAALDMEAKLHVQAPSSDRRKGAFPRGGRKEKAAFAHAGSGSASDSDSQADVPSAADTDVAAALTQAGLGVLQQQKRFSPTTASASTKGKDKGRRPSTPARRPNLPKDVRMPADPLNPSTLPWHDLKIQEGVWRRRKDRGVNLLCEGQHFLHARPGSVKKLKLTLGTAVPSSVAPSSSEEDEFATASVETPQSVGAARAASFCYEDPDPDQEPEEHELQTLAAFFFHLKEQKKVKSDLILLRPLINHIRINGLLDCGATRNFMSPRVIKKLHLGMKVEQLQHPLQVKIGDFTTVTLREKVRGIPVTFDSAEEVRHRMNFYTFPDQPFDLVFSMQWLRAVNPRID